jgi:hypothetical protein
MWYERHQSNNPLSYPSKTTVARAGEGRSGVARSIVPTQMLPAHLATVDRALGIMPEDMRVALLCRHLADYPRYHRETGNSRSTYYNQADSGYWFIAGVVNTDIERVS